MSADSGEIPFCQPAPAWSELLDRVRGQTVMVVGRPGSGKSHLATFLVESCSGGGRKAALLSADVGQPSVGLPTCLGLSLAPPWTEPSALWFVGDITPVGNLLPVAVGTARLALVARSSGCQTVIIDTSGLVEGPLGRMLKYHKALASQVDCVVAIQRDDELLPLLGLLRTAARSIFCVSPAEEAVDRSVEDRRSSRTARYGLHFAEAAPLTMERVSLIGVNWAPGDLIDYQSVASETLTGLLDERGFCLALGLVEEVTAETVTVCTPWRAPLAVAQIKLGKLRLIGASDFREAR